MRSLLLRASALAAVATLACSAPANARFVQVVVQGVVTDGFDKTGVFGAANTSLDGASFTARYAFDEAFGFGPEIFYYGNGEDPDSFKATLEINGQSAFIGCDYFVNPCAAGLRVRAGEGGLWGVEVYLFKSIIDYEFLGGKYTGYTRNESNDLGFTFLSPNDPFVKIPDFRARASHSYLPGDTATGYFAINYDRWLNNVPVAHVREATGVLMPLSISVSIPEPATWMTMILGFGMLGAALRRRAGATARAAG